MCARLFYLILAALVVFNVVTVVAFVYLPWWQALIVVLATILALTFAGKYLIRSFFRNMMQMSQEMLGEQAKVLKNASIAVHTIRPAEIPQEVRELFDEVTNEDADPAEIAQERFRYERLVWREIELTIFPDGSQLQPGENAAWYPHSLSLVPTNWKYEDDFNLEDNEDDDGSLAIYELQLLEEGRVIDAADDGEAGVTGVQRMRFVVGVPQQLREAALAYFTERFGLIALPGTLPPRRTP